jgi:hypothetical protein
MKIIAYRRRHSGIQEYLFLLRIIIYLKIECLTLKTLWTTVMALVLIGAHS